MGALWLGGYSLLSGLCGENMERSERNRSVVRKDPGREEKGVGSGSAWITTLAVEQSYCRGSASDRGEQVVSLVTMGNLCPK